MDLDQARNAIRQANFASEKSVVREMIAATRLSAAARARIVAEAETMVGHLRADPFPPLRWTLAAPPYQPLNATAAGAASGQG